MAPTSSLSSLMQIASLVRLHSVRRSLEERQPLTWDMLVTCFDASQLSVLANLEDSLSADEAVRLVATTLFYEPPHSALALLHRIAPHKSIRDLEYVEHSADRAADFLRNELHAYHSRKTHHIAGSLESYRANLEEYFMIRARSVAGLRRRLPATLPIRL